MDILWTKRIAIASRAFTGFAVASCSAIALAIPAAAADYAAHPREQTVQIDRGRTPYCGPQCGCPVYDIVRHRELRMGFASSSDPREHDEPTYYYGAVKSYARFERSGGPNCADQH